MHVSNGMCAWAWGFLPKGMQWWNFLGGLFPPSCHVWSTAPREHPARTAATWQGGGLRPENLSGKWARIPEHVHTTADHMHHTSHIMCIVTVWHPSIGNIIPILGYVTLDIPVTVVTSGELRNQNWAVSKTKTWQPYGASMCSMCRVRSRSRGHSSCHCIPTFMPLVIWQIGWNRSRLQRHSSICRSPQ